MSNPPQLFLLADHIKISLLERERAASLRLEPNAQETEIYRSLESLRKGVEGLEQTQNASAELESQSSRLRRQYDELSAQFQRLDDRVSTESTQSKVHQTPKYDRHATQTTRSPPSKTTSSSSAGQLNRISAAHKSVRFTDNPSSPTEESNREGLFPYKDDPAEDEPPDHSELGNQQIHEYHSQVLRDQDDQLDTLGRSIGRQRELSIQIGDELDDQVRILDHVEDGVDRHQTQLDRARTRVSNIASKAKDNMQLTVILILIIILILLIIVLR